MTVFECAKYGRVIKRLEEVENLFHQALQEITDTVTLKREVDAPIRGVADLARRYRIGEKTFVNDMFNTCDTQKCEECPYATKQGVLL
jgi:hypothetical protein